MTTLTRTKTNIKGKQAYILSPHSRNFWICPYAGSVPLLMLQQQKRCPKALHLIQQSYVVCSKSIWRDFFSMKTNEAQEVCCGREAEGTFTHIHGFFPASRQRQSRAASVWMRVYMQHKSHCYFLRKWRNDSSSGITSNFARSLAIAKWKPFRRFSGFSATMPWASHKLRNGTTDSKMGACQWIATLILVGPQAEMTSSLTKCGLLSCRTIMSPAENLWRRWR